MADDAKVIKAICNYCKGLQNHSIRDEYPVKPKPESNSKITRIEIEHWEIFQCDNCGSIKAIHSVSYPDVKKERVTHYPPENRRSTPIWLMDMPDEMQELYDEVHSAINMENRRLAAMGTRALLDMAFNERIGDLGYFETKLDKMVEQGYLARDHRDTIYSALDVGSAASHRGHNPTSEELDDVMEITENFLQQQYSLSRKRDRLISSVPARNIQKKGGQ